MIKTRRSQPMRQCKAQPKPVSLFALPLELRYMVYREIILSTDEPFVIQYPLSLFLRSPLSQQHKIASAHSLAYTSTSIFEEYVKILAEVDHPMTYKIVLAPFVGGQNLLSSTAAPRWHLGRLDSLHIIPSTEVRLDIDIRVHAHRCPSDGDLVEPPAHWRNHTFKGIADEYWRFILATLVVMIKKTSSMQKLTIRITSPQRKAYEAVQEELQNRILQRLGAHVLPNLKELIIITREDGRDRLHICSIDGTILGA